MWLARLLDSPASFVRCRPSGALAFSSSLLLAHTIGRTADLIERDSCLLNYSNVKIDIGDIVHPTIRRRVQPRRGHEQARP